MLNFFYVLLFIYFKDSLKFFFLYYINFFIKFLIILILIVLIFNYFDFIYQKILERFFKSKVSLYIINKNDLIKSILVMLMFLIYYVFYLRIIIFFSQKVPNINFLVLSNDVFFFIKNSDVVKFFYISIYFVIFYFLFLNFFKLLFFFAKLHYLKLHYYILIRNNFYRNFLFFLKDFEYRNLIFFVSLLFIFVDIDTNIYILYIFL